MSAVPSKPSPQASDPTSRRISVDAYYGVPQASQPARHVFANPSSHRPVLSQAQLLQLDPDDRRVLDQLQHSLKLEWRRTELAYCIERGRLEVSIHESRTWRNQWLTVPSETRGCVLVSIYAFSKPKPRSTPCALSVPRL